MLSGGGNGKVSRYYDARSRANLVNVYNGGVSLDGVVGGDGDTQTLVRTLVGGFEECFPSGSFFK
jgi:hypothetical protein